MRLRRLGPAAFMLVVGKNRNVLRPLHQKPEGIKLGRVINSLLWTAGLLTGFRYM
jgi:hypothetical protein